MEAFLGRGEQRRRIAERWTFLPLLLSAMAAIAAGATEHPLAFCVTAMLAVGAQAVIASARRADRPDDEEALGEVEVTPRGIVDLVRGGMVFSREELDAGWIEPGKGAIVRTRWGHTVRLACDAATGRVALEALGLHASGRATSLPVAGFVESRLEGPPVEGVGAGARVLRVLLPTLALLPALAAGGLSPRAAAGPLSLQVAVAVLALLPALALALFARMVRRDLVTIGSETIVIARAGGTESVHLRDVTRIEAADLATRIHRRDGATVELRTATGGAGLGARLGEAKAAFDATDSDPRAEILDRGERSADAWADHLGKLAQGTVGYRSTSLGPDELIAVVVDPSAPADRRVGAAYLLATTEGGAPHRDRVRIATEACADEDTRYALELAAEGELVAEGVAAVRSRSALRR